MEIFLIRHARAVAPDASTDAPGRALAPERLQKWRRAVRGLGRLGVTFDRLYHGPSLRAVQTADVLASLVDGETVVTTLFDETPGPNLLDQIAGERVAIVGNDPWLGQLLGWLLLGNAEKRRPFDLGKGHVAWLEGQPRSARMTLRALLPQKTLRVLGRRG